MLTLKTASAPEGMHQNTTFSDKIQESVLEMGSSLPVYPFARTNSLGSYDTSIVAHLELDHTAVHQRGPSSLHKNVNVRYKSSQAPCIHPFRCELLGKHRGACLR